MNRRTFIQHGLFAACAGAGASLAAWDRGWLFSRLTQRDGTLPGDQPAGMDATPDVIAPAGRLRKCLSLGGPQTQAGVASPNALRDPWSRRCAPGDPCGNREFIQASVTTWVRLQISWWGLQELWGPPAVPTPPGYAYPSSLPPADWRAAWRHLNFARNVNEISPCAVAAKLDRLPAIQRLDREIRAANEVGCGVILNLYHDFPTWTAATAAPIDCASAIHGQIWNGVVPDDLSPNSPWGWFVAYLLARYRRGAPRNPIGPGWPGEPGAAGRAGHDPLLGNPSGAWIDALEICNEPNIFFDQDRLPERVAEMIETAATLTSTGGGDTLSHQLPYLPALLGGAAILAPATADRPDPGDRSGRTPQTDWRSFTVTLLRELRRRKFTPRSAVHWSHHNYRDVRRPWLAPRPPTRGVRPARSRAEEVVQLLHHHRWAGDRERMLWLTEAGFRVNLPTRDRGGGATGGGASSAGGTYSRDLDAQAAAIKENFHAMEQIPEVFMWTHYKINGGDPYDTDLREPPVGGRPGATRPAWHTWRTLPAARDPSHP